MEEVLLLSSRRGEARGPGEATKVHEGAWWAWWSCSGAQAHWGPPAAGSAVQRAPPGEPGVLWAEGAAGASPARAVLLTRRPGAQPQPSPTPGERLAGLPRLPRRGSGRRARRLLCDSGFNSGACQPGPTPPPAPRPSPSSGSAAERANGRQVGRSG